MSNLLHTPVIVALRMPDHDLHHVVIGKQSGLKGFNGSCNSKVQTTLQNHTALTVSLACLCPIPCAEIRQVVTVQPVMKRRQLL